MNNFCEILSYLYAQRIHTNADLGVEVNNTPISHSKYDEEPNNKNYMEYRITELKKL